MCKDYDEARYEQEKAWGEEQEHLASESAAAEAEAQAEYEAMMNKPMDKEKLKEEMACLLCGGLFCDKHPVNTEGKPFSLACVEALVVAAAILRLFEQYCEDKKIMQVVEGELPNLKEVRLYGGRNADFECGYESGFNRCKTEAKRAGYVKVKKVRLVE